MRLIVICLVLVCCLGSSRRALMEAKQKRLTVAGGVDNTLILRYKFDEGSGTAVADTTANNNDATLSGATWVTGKSGSGSAAHFDGTDDFLQSDAAITYGVQIITVCFWVKATWPSGASTFQIVESSANGVLVNAKSFSVFADFSTLQTYLTGDAFSARSRTDTPDPTDATWVHLAMVFDNSTTDGEIVIYYDGALQTSDSYSTSKTGIANFAAETLNIGSRNGLSRFAAMDVDDFRIYSGQLDATEIAYVRDNPDE